MRITIISDNTIYPIRSNSSNGVYKPKLKSEWGFCCLIEIENTQRILFDTGASGSVLLYNMEKLNIDAKTIDCVFISHNHWDHTGGLKGFLKLNDNVKLYLPYSFFSFTKPKAREVIKVKDSVKIYENVLSTGELLGIEQSMIVRLNKGLVVIVGCSHPGVENILEVASKFGKIIALIGGLHGFCEFGLIKDLNLVCATHCTQYKKEIKRLYPEKSVEGGSGRIIEI